MFCQIWGVFSHYFFEYIFFSALPCIASLYRLHDTNVRSLGRLPQVLEALFISPHPTPAHVFSLHCSDWVISIFLSSSSLIYPSSTFCCWAIHWIFNCVKIHITRNSLVFQWLGFGGFTAMAWVQSMVQELKSHSCAGQPKKKKIHTFIILTIFKCTFF